MKCLVVKHDAEGESFCLELPDAAARENVKEVVALYVRPI
jgi:hypothetical protein